MGDAPGMPSEEYAESAYCLPSEEETARLISGAPFPSPRSLAKARAILSLIRPAFEAKEREAVEAHADFRRLNRIAEEWKTRAQCAELDRSKATEFRLRAEARLAQAVEDEREACRIISENEILRARGNPTDLRTVQHRIDAAIRARASAAMGEKT
jgi:hypothetical protein